MLRAPRIISPHSILLHLGYLSQTSHIQTMLISISTSVPSRNYSISLNSNSTFPIGQARNLRTIFSSFLLLSSHPFLNKCCYRRPLKHIQNPATSHYLHLDYPMQTMSLVWTTETQAYLGLILPHLSPYTQVFHKAGGAMLSLNHYTDRVTSLLKIFQGLPILLTSM